MEECDLGLVATMSECEERWYLVFVYVITLHDAVGRLSASQKIRNQHPTRLDSNSLSPHVAP